MSKRKVKDMSDRQRKAVMAKMGKTKNVNSSRYAVVNKNTNSKQYIYGDADKDKTPNIDDQKPYDKNNKKTVGDFSLAKDFKDIEQEGRERKKPMNKIEKHYQKEGYETISRTKGLHSTLNKLKRKHIHRIRDLAGMTVFVKNEKEAHKVGRDIEKNYDVIEKDDYYENPRPDSNYKAIHYVVMKDGKPVEIHVQTKKQFEESQKTHGAYKRGEIDVIVRDDDFYAKKKNES